jgi:SAM-dependent methyltransferase
MRPDFSRRAATPELMDTEPTGFETFRDCLADLAQVNRLTLAYRPTLAFLERLRRAGRLDGRTLRIVDVGSGYGDMLRRIDRWARSRGVAVDLAGVDLNPWSAQAARAATPPDRPIRWLTADCFAYEGEFDLVISSLFTHHLDDATLIRFLAWMEDRARLGWFVNDLHRLAFPYYGFGLLAWLMRWHRFVRHDGPVSIARAFRPAEWRGLVSAAGLDASKVGVARVFPFRLCVARVKP